MKNARRIFLKKMAIGSSGILIGGLRSSAKGYGKISKTKNTKKCNIIFKNGEAKIKIGNEVFSPMAFRSFRAEAYNVRDFYKSGVRLMNILHSGMPTCLGVPYSQYGEHWIGIGKYDFSKIDDQMRIFIDNAPDAYFNIMLMLDTRSWYLAKYPEYPNSYHHLSSVAGDNKWRMDVTQYINDIVLYFENNYGDRIFAYSLLAGSTTEWYTEITYATGSSCYKPDGSKLPIAAIDISRNAIKEHTYQKWLNKPSAKLPTLDAIEQTSHGVFRDLSIVKDKEGFDYWQFQSKIIGETACYFTKVVKEVTNNNKLTGLFYGYLTYLSGRRLLCNGHLGFEQVWNSPYIDIIYGPARYETRQLTDASGYLIPVDSVALKNKLYFQEIDYRFAIGNKQKLENGINLGLTQTGPISVSKNCIRREFINTLEKRSGMWWFDFFGYNYTDPILIKEVKDTMDVRQKIINIDMQKISEIAIFTDTESEFYLNQDSDIDIVNKTKQITEFSFLGAPHDSFTFSDLERACDNKNYKLIFFLNTFYIPEEKIIYINEKLKKDGRTLVFLYAPGYITNDRFSVEKMSALLEMNIKCEMKPTKKIILRKILQQEFAGITFGYVKEVSPKFSVVDENITVVGEYEDGGIAFALKKLKKYNIYYAGSGTIPYKVLREIARNAGVHIYYEGNDPVYINSRMVGVHHVKDEDIVIQMPRDCSGELLFGGGRIISNNRKFEIKVHNGEMIAVLLDEPIRLS